jgi:hypothetical protein
LGQPAVTYAPRPGRGNVAMDGGFGPPKNISGQITAERGEEKAGLTPAEL